MIGFLIIILSCLLAHLLPIELLLFSYAFLGPAHYLTEISWLHDRKYFARHRWFAAIAASATVGVIFWPEAWSGFIWGSLILAVFVSNFKSSVVRLSLVLLLLLTYYFVGETSKVNLIVTGLIPTIIHVYLFTFLFSLSGYLKRRENKELINIILVVLASLSFFVVSTEPMFLFKDWAMKNGSGFFFITYDLADAFNINARRDVPIFFVLSKFIAFAYTYHYINWFAKTKITAWHLLSKRRLAFICVAYVVFISIYLYDYTKGLETLFFLSVLHVVLEFPLNVATIKGMIPEAQMKKARL